MNQNSVIEELLAGFHRFSKGERDDRKKGVDYARTLAERQEPKAVVVTCSDSRVAPELLFDTGFGELFVIRTAGNILSGYDIASIEYAVQMLGVNTIVIMGHSNCGAVKAAVDDLETDSVHIQRLKEDIARLIRTVSPEASIDDMTREYVRQTAASLKERSTILRDGEKVEIFAGFYDIGASLISFDF